MTIAKLTRDGTGYLLLLLIAGFLATGCARPTPANTQQPMPETTVFADDFSRPSPAWARYDNEAGAVYALAGELFLEDRGQGRAVYAPLIGYDIRDVTIYVDVRHVQGSVDNWMGLVCRQQDERNFYLLAISADSYYLILKMVDGAYVPLAGPEYSDAIQPGRAENQLRARCNGAQLSLWANDTHLGTVTDEAILTAGNVALFADAVTWGGTVLVAFDNFVLTSP